MTCPLCLESDISFYHQDKRRDYWQCGHCDLVFVEPKNFLSAEDEKREYDLHQNDPNDLGYRRFLNKLVEPMIERLTPGSKGLDFGCGPGPTLALMFQELGFATENYDPIYANRPELLHRQYDFICATEVLEHLHQPHKELNLLKKMLKANGLFGIMTKRVIDLAAFKNWHYKNDPTHVCFYSEATFKYIAAHWDLNLNIISSDTVILQNNPN
ncbi:MAG: class I SAM-dependent methyltransferase [Gammaproteobacteria bacterium]|nr:class I SAM-dependent methyltransferase [Gammaproteobacteria bacterium]